MCNVIVTIIEHVNTVELVTCLHMPVPHLEELHEVVELAMDVTTCRKHNRAHERPQHKTNETITASAMLWFRLLSYCVIGVMLQCQRLPAVADAYVRACAAGLLASSAARLRLLPVLRLPVRVWVLLGVCVSLDEQVHMQKGSFRMCLCVHGSACCAGQFSIAQPGMQFTVTQCKDSSCLVSWCQLQRQSLNVNTVSSAGCEVWTMGV